MARSSGIAVKVIHNKTVTNKCPICLGTKEFKTGSIDSSNIKNLKMTGDLQITEDCKHCNGTGSISHSLRVIKANKKIKMPQIISKRV